MANSTRKIEISYSPVVDTFYCPDCFGAMRIERLSRRLLALRCTVCNHAVDGRLVDFGAARIARDGYYARLQAAEKLAEKWAAIELDLTVLRNEVAAPMVIEAEPVRRSWLAGLFAR